MSKSILIIDMPEDFDYRKCSFGGDGNIYYERKGEQRTSIIGNIKNLKPMPEKKHNNGGYRVIDGTEWWYDSEHDDGWNDCIDLLLGEEE